MTLKTEWSTAVWHLAAVLTMCVWGTTFISTKVLLLHGLTPAHIFLLRFAQAYVGILLVEHKRWLCRDWRDELHMLVLGVCGGSLYFLTENTALRHTLAGNVSLEVCMAPLITQCWLPHFVTSITGGVCGQGRCWHWAAWRWWWRKPMPYSTLMCGAMSWLFARLRYGPVTSCLPIP